jgi:hypothetical protein
MRMLRLTLPFLLWPALALAQSAPSPTDITNKGPGSGTDRERVRRDMDAMQRNGHWAEAMAEGRANKQAFDAWVARSRRL